jgi:hypothetical protein
MSCLFNSIGAFLRIDGFKVRQLICDYLEKNLPIIEDMETKTILDIEDVNYIQKMRDVRVFGGANEIKVACNLWSLKIKVIHGREGNFKEIVFYPLSGCYKYTIHLMYQNSNHYEPVVPVVSNK